jgi:hypothetical protein
MYKGLLDEPNRLVYQIESLKDRLTVKNEKNLRHHHDQNGRSHYSILKMDEVWKRNVV